MLSFCPTLFLIIHVFVDIMNSREDRNNYYVICVYQSIIPARISIADIILFTTQDVYRDVLFVLNDSLTS